MFNLYPHQIDALERVKNYNRCAFYLDMGLGKTFCGSEKAVSLRRTILLICPATLIKNWVSHFQQHYPYLTVRDCSKNRKNDPKVADVWIMSYDIVWRRDIDIKDYTLLLDESSYIQHDTSNRTKAILKLKPKNVILLSGTPTAGRYEFLYTQLRLLGWDISKKKYWNDYIVYHEMDCKVGFPIKKVDGYKNIPELKSQLTTLGCVFMKTEEVIDLPEQVEINIACEECAEYKTYKKDKVVEVDGQLLLGDGPLVRLLHMRKLSSVYCHDKLEQLKVLLNSTGDRLLIFYNFDDELQILQQVIKRPISYINGSAIDKKAYETYSNSVTLIQYQAGAVGHNLQLANKIIYFSPPLSAELYLQSKKRTHRIGQSRTCYYYHLISGVEYDIYDTLDRREDYTLKLFEKL